jgi:hypothetical protein
MRQYNTPEHEFKPENVFNIDYFKSGNVYAQENLKIDIEIIRKFFLEVIYQNAFIESDKNERIDLIINIIFALSYILNHTAGGGPGNDTELINFAFIILGLGVFNNYGLAKYNQIKELIEDRTNGIQTEEFLNKYLEKFFPFALSYTYKDQEPIYKMYNDMTMSYVKNLSIFNANKLAYEIITDDQLNGNTYKVLQFVNTWKFESENNEILKDMITFMFYYKKIQALTGSDTDIGVLYMWINKNKTEDENINNLTHPYALIDYLKEIDYKDIIEKIDNSIDTYKTKLNELNDLTNYDMYNTMNDYNEQLDNYHDPVTLNTPNYNSETADCFKYNLLFDLLIQKLINYLTELTIVKDNFLKVFFEQIFGKDESFTLKPTFTNPECPLYYKNQMMRYLEDTLECIISNYNIDYDNLNDDKLDTVLSEFKNHLQLPIEIFKRELNNTLLPYFNISDPNNDFIKLVKNKLANIYDITVGNSYVNKNPNLIPKYIWTKNYDPADPDGSELVDKQIFTFINKLLNAKDQNNNYYLNSGNHGDLMKTLGNIDNNESDQVYTNFSKEMLKDAYLFNDHEFNLNVKQVKDNLQTLYSDIPGFRDSYTDNGIDYDYIKKNISTNYLFINIFNSINNLVQDSIGKVIYENKNPQNAKINDLHIPTVLSTNHLNITKHALVYREYIDLGNFKTKLNRDINIDFSGVIEKIMSNQNCILWSFCEKKVVDANWSVPDINLIKLFDHNNVLQTNLKDFILNITNAFQTLNTIYPQIDTILRRKDYGRTYIQIQNEIKIFNDLVNAEIDKLNKLKIFYIHDTKHINGYDIIIDDANPNGIIKFYYNGNEKTAKTFQIIYEFYNNIPNNIPNNKDTFNLKMLNNLRDDAQLIDKKRYVHEYFRNIYDFIDGLSEDVKKAARIVPINFNSKYINQNISHRNNLYLAVANMGFLNSKSIDYLSKNNIYFDIKINMLNTIYNKDKTLLGDTNSYAQSLEAYNNLKTFLDNNNIFIEEKINDNELTDIMKKYTKPKSLDIKFQNSTGEVIYPQPLKRCLYWTYPLFNINFGRYTKEPNPPQPAIELENNYNLDYQRSPHIYKILLTKFINKQYSIISDNPNPLNMLGVLHRIEKYYLSDTVTQKLPKKYEELPITKIIKNPTTTIITDLNKSIQQYYEKLIQILQQFNNANIVLTLPPKIDDIYIQKLSKQLNNYISIGPLRKNIIECLFEIFNSYLIHDSLSKYPSLAFNKFNIVKQDFVKQDSVNNDAKLFNFIYIIFRLINTKANVISADNNNIITIYNQLPKPNNSRHSQIIYNNDYQYLNDPADYAVPTGPTNIFAELSYINPNSIKTIFELYATEITKEKYDNKHLVFLDYKNMVIDGFDQFLNDFRKITNTPNTGLADYRKIMMEIIKNTSPNNIYNGLHIFTARIKELFAATQGPIKIVSGGFRPSITINAKSTLNKTTLNNYTQYYLASSDKSKKKIKRKTKKNQSTTPITLNKKQHNSLKQINTSSRKTKKSSTQLLEHGKHKLSRNKYRV